MLNNDYSTASILLTYIGLRVDMDYGNNGSSAYTQDLVERVFNFHGLDCRYGDYTPGVIHSQIVNKEMPIIVSARYRDANNDTHGHSFIIDGCIYTRDEIVNVYSWVYDEHPEGILLPNLPEMEERLLVYGVTSGIYMNWGYGSLFDSSCFSPGGDWNLTTHINYNINRKMIYDFSINQQ